MHYNCTTLYAHGLEQSLSYLQVRDFPEDLHKELKLLAKKEHRSVSQQTVLAVREHVAQASSRVPRYQVDRTFAPNQKLEEEDFLTKRQRVLAQIERLEIPDTSNSPEDIVGIIQDGRDELDARVGL